MRQDRAVNTNFSIVLLFVIVLLLTACGSVTQVTVATDPPTVSATPIATPPLTTAAPKPTTIAPTNPLAALPTVTPIPASTTAISATVAPTVPASGSKLPGKIVFDTDKKEIFTIDLTTGVRTKVINGSSPIFAPDGKRIAYVATPPDFEDNYKAKAIIRVVNLDGSGGLDLCGGAENQLFKTVRWSPRDRFIAFNNIRRGTDSYGEIGLCNTSTKTISTAAIKTKQGSATTFYDWSPDGDYALWHTIGNDKWSVSYGDPDKAGEDATTLASIKIEPIGIPSPEYGGSRFSPDGKTIAIVEISGKMTFYSVPGQKSALEGAVLNMKPLDSKSAYFGKIAWSPDGKAVAVFAYIDQAQLINLYDVSNPSSLKFVQTLVTNAGGDFDWTRP